MTAARIVICANSAWNLRNFRARLISDLIAGGAEVVAVAPPDGPGAASLEGLGCRFEPVPIDARGLSPLGDAMLAMRLTRVLRRLEPDVFLGFTVKPNVYGSLAARLCGVPVVNNLSGLGTAFIRDGWLTRLVKGLYRVSLAGSAVVFFQNPDDLDLFVEAGIARADQARLLPGSGVDLDRFGPLPLYPREESEGPVFLLVARLLRDKGVGEYVEAARQIRARAPGARFRLLGSVDAANRTAVPLKTVEAWTSEGVVDYLGATEDVRPHIAEADCVVLPSYREGTPRSLLEAAAMGRPLIATDVPGCREVVEDGVNGFLCEARSAGSLARAIERFMGLGHDQRQAMGTAGRDKVERAFDERIVIEAYHEAIRAHAKRPPARGARRAVPQTAPSGKGRP